MNGASMPVFSKFTEELDSVISRDPAAGGRISVLFLYPSVHVMLAHRLAHRLWRWGFKITARFIMQFARMLTGIELHPGARCLLYTSPSPRD